MSNFTGFTQKDFDVFTIPGLEPRMDVLKTTVRPKLEQLGAILSPYLSALCGEDIYPHVAKHARRSVNPPNDTWVAFANSKKGYKALPHFQIGLWSTHVFIQFAVIYESPEYKARFAKQLKRHLTRFTNAIPSDYFWSLDHMKPDVVKAADMSAQDYKNLIHKLHTIKKTEALCGLQLLRDNPVVGDGQRFIETAEQTFSTLLPLYRAAFYK